MSPTFSDVASNSRDHRVQQSAIALPKHWQSASHTLPRSQSPASTSGKPKSPIQRQFRCCVTAASKPMSPPPPKYRRPSPSLRSPGRPRQSRCQSRCQQRPPRRRRRAVKRRAAKRRRGMRRAASRQAARQRRRPRGGRRQGRTPAGSKAGGGGGGTATSMYAPSAASRSRRDLSRSRRDLSHISRISRTE